ncbi:MAG: hypothetical protein ACLQU5_22030 [Isosphaeraceae bacterium]
MGGPEIAGTRAPRAARFLRDFIEHCLRRTNHATGKVGAPLDFLAFHAKGSPRIALGHVQMGIATQLQDEVVAGFPELKRSAQLEAITSPCRQRPQAGALSLNFPLPRQAVSLVTPRW